MSSPEDGVEKTADKLYFFLDQRNICWIPIVYLNSLLIEEADNIKIWI